MGAGIACLVAGLVVQEKSGSEGAGTVFTWLGVGMIAVGAICFVALAVMLFPHFDA